MAGKYIVSLKDIAGETGVSVSTVSRVIKKKGEIGAQTRERVMQAAKRLGYHSNLLIEGIKTGKTRTIGVVAPIADPFLNRIVCGIHDTLVERDYTMTLVWPDGDGKSELEQIHRLMQRRVEGIIIRPTNDDASPDYFREVIDSGVPIVAVDRALPKAGNISFVGSNDLKGACLATEHLIAKGHTVIGHIQGPQFTSTGRLRRQGFEQAIAPHESVRGIVSDFETFSMKSIDEVGEFVAANPDMTAVFASNDEVAVAVYKALGKVGRRVPEDLSVISFADDYAQILAPELSAIEQNPYLIGQTAAGLMLTQLSQGHSTPEDVIIDPVLVDRQSVAST